MLFNAGVSHKKIGLPLGPILYTMTKEDCDTSSYPWAAPDTNSSHHAMAQCKFTGHHTEDT
eukprot:3327857-Ditylum_brightwellii.AAC.1